MRTNKIDNHSRKGYIIYQTKYLDELISKGKIKQAKLLINDLIKEYPNDIGLIYEWSRILGFEGNYQEAYELLKSLEATEKYYPFSLTILAIMNKDMASMEYYYYKYFANVQYFKEIFQNTLKIYLQKIFEPNKPIILEDYDYNVRGSYHIKQVANYDEEKAYQHIMNHHVFSNNPDKCIFNPTIDIRDLMRTLKKLIEENPGKSCLENWQEIYYFYYPQCGKNNGKHSKYTLNYLSVSTIPNTSNILSIFPCKEGNLLQPLIFPMHEEEQKGKELKRISQIDKFNMRYGKNK